MYLFALLLFPCAFVYYVSRRFADLRPRLLISLAAFVASALICAFRGFYLFRSMYDGGNVLYFFLEQWISCALFPFFVYGLFVLLARDDRRVKISSYALFMLPFYAVYLPAEIFANPVLLPFFYLFIKPALYLVMVVAVAGELRTLSEAMVQKGGALAVSVIVMLFELAAPALIESL